MMAAKYPKIAVLAPAWLLLMVVALGCDPADMEHQSADADSQDISSPDIPDISDIFDVFDEPPPFHPTHIAGLSLYFDAGDSETLTMSPEGRVSVWQDLSGQDNHAYQASDRLMPVYQASGQGGRGVLEFDSSYMTTSDLLQLRATEQGYTIFAVALSTVADGVEGDEGRAGVLLGNYRRPHASFAVELHHDRRLRHWWDRREAFGQTADGNRGDAIFDAPRPARGAFAILTFSLDTQEQEVGAAVDGEFAAPLPDDGFVFEVERPLRIGADYREQNLPTAWKGSIGALLVYDHLLSDSEIDQVHRHLSETWDIPLIH